jgi:putative colanic acid biosysnthesis UDP-glucose lipid carrier transferase
MSILLRIAFIAGDWMLLNLSIIFSYKLSGLDLWGPERGNSLYLFIFSNLAWLFLIIVSNPYTVSGNWSPTKIFKNQSSFIFIHLLVVGSLIYFFKRNYTTQQIVIIYLLFVPAFFIWKQILLYFFRMVGQKNLIVRNVIVIGNGELVRQVRRYFSVHADLGFRFLRIFESGRNGIPLAEVEKFCLETSVHEIYCCMDDFDHLELKRMVDFGINSFIHVKLIANPSSIQNSINLEHFDQIPVLNVDAIPLDDHLNQFIKRIFDLILSSLVIAFVLAWLLPLVAIAIKLDSPGPVFFRQRRSGIINKPFDCLKFRTMKINQEADMKQASRDDVRITRVGSFLRRSSLDEFPQFFNVLMGSMSIVGPRPHMIAHSQEYSKIIVKFIGRHYVSPGITGLAQCLGYRGEIRNLNDMKNRVKLDRFYIEKWSFLLDIKIIFLTIISLFRGSEKAY